MQSLLETSRIIFTLSYITDILKKSAKEGSKMEKIKKAFFDLLHGYKPTFIFVVAQLSIGLLFWLAILLPYIVHPDLIDGSVSASELPGGTWFTLAFLALTLFFAYLVIVGQKKQSDQVFFIQAIIASAIFLYALVIHKVGLSFAKNGIGKIIQFLMITFFWLMIFGKKIVLQFITKIFPNKPAIHQEEVKQ